MELQAYQPGPGKATPPATGRQRSHHWKGTKRAAPDYGIASEAPTNAAITRLFPWTVATYPGRLKGALILLQDRAAADSIRDWRRGKRRAPQWARDILIRELARRAAEFHEAIEMLQKENSLPE